MIQFTFCTECLTEWTWIKDKKLAWQKTALLKKTNVLISTRIPKTLRLSVTKCYKRSSFVTRMQNILHSTINTLETDEMWFLKRMLHEEVMDRTGTKKRLMKVILTRQIGFLTRFWRQGFENVSNMQDKKNSCKRKTNYEVSGQLFANAWKNRCCQSI